MDGSDRWKARTDGKPSQGFQRERDRELSIRMTLHFSVAVLESRGLGSSKFRIRRKVTSRVVLCPLTPLSSPSWQRPGCSLPCAVKGGPWRRRRPAAERASERVPRARAFPQFSVAVAAPAVRDAFSITAPALQATLGVLGARTGFFLCCSLTPEAGTARAAQVT